MNSVERRAYPRRSTSHLQAWISLHDDASATPCRVLDTSATGALVETGIFLPTEMTLQLALEYRDQSDRALMFVRKAKVVRRTTDGVGVKFDHKM